MDWFDLLVVQGTLKSLLQHHISKASILWRSAFFIVQLSCPYMTKGKTIREYQYNPCNKAVLIERGKWFTVGTCGGILARVLGGTCYWI